MDNQGIMAEIRTLLLEGNSPTQIIAMGYKTSSVYKAQQQIIRRPSSIPYQVPAQTPAQVIFANNGDPQAWLELREENQNLHQQLQDKEEQTAKLTEVQEELDRARDRIQKLEAVAQRGETLKARIAELEPIATSAAEAQNEAKRWQARYFSLSAQNVQEVQDWEQKLAAEQEARSEAEGQIVWYEKENARLKEANQELLVRLEQQPDQILQIVREQLRPVNQELEQLRPLKAWAGHPCTECGKPVNGVPSREVAGKILRKGRLVHKGCAYD